MHACLLLRNSGRPSFIFGLPESEDFRQVSVQGLGVSKLIGLTPVVSVGLVLTHCFFWCSLSTQTWLAGGVVCDVLITSVIVYVVRTNVASAWNVYLTWNTTAMASKQPVSLQPDNKCSHKNYSLHRWDGVTHFHGGCARVGPLVSPAPVLRPFHWVSWRSSAGVSYLTDELCQISRPRKAVCFSWLFYPDEWSPWHRYSNALVATLNSRALVFGTIQNGAFINSTGSAIPHPSSSFWDDAGPKITAPLGALRSQTVHVTRTTEVHEDGNSHEMIVVSVRFEQIHMRRRADI